MAEGQRPAGLVPVAPTSPARPITAAGLRRKGTIVRYLYLRAGWSAALVIRSPQPSPAPKESPLQGEKPCPVWPWLLLLPVLAGSSLSADRGPRVSSSSLSLLFSSLSHINLFFRISSFSLFFVSFNLTSDYASKCRLGDALGGRGTGLASFGHLAHIHTYTFTL
ncbi:hypothetical protein F5884DRAFT_428621 [Xylogone sp. PMI_703]|nr:hypothetical protein F5884DRAFT_428621 [Xylogone sp. PMI_703]